MIDVDAKEEQKPAGLFSVYPSYYGQDGNSDNTAIPRLVWQYQKYLAKQLYKFNEGEKGDRNNSLMHSTTILLNDKESLSLTTHYAKQKIDDSV